jgi:hypothetical protein
MADSPRADADADWKPTLKVTETTSTKAGALAEGDPEDEHPEFTAMHNQRLDLEITLIALSPAIAWSLFVRLLFGWTGWFAHGLLWIPAIILFSWGPRLLGRILPPILRYFMELPDLVVDCDTVHLRPGWRNCEICKSSCCKSNASIRRNCRVSQLTVTLAARVATAR